MRSPDYEAISKAFDLVGGVLDARKSELDDELRHAFRNALGSVAKLGEIIERRDKGTPASAAHTAESGMLDERSEGDG